MINPCAIVGFVLALFAGMAGAWINGTRWEARYTTLQAEHAQAVADAAAQDAQRRLSLIRQVKDANDALDITKTANDRLARCLADGTCGVRVAARCPSVPAAHGAAAGAVADAPELDPAARQDYLALRAGLAEQYALLTKCRGYAQEMSR